MKSFLLAIVFAAAALAQTRPHTSQIRGPQSQQPQLLAIVNGRVVNVALGAGVQLVQVAGAWELRATAAATTDARLTRGADGTWSLPQGCGLRAVYRNGLRQAAGVDYSVSGQAVRFTDGASDPSLPDDMIVAECLQ